ncbi:hypothetical protein Gpo141_00013531 [Globisporangium polare]
MATRKSHRVRATHQLVLVLVLTATQIFFFPRHLKSVDAVKAPNYFLGTCLDEAWVKKVEADLAISRYQRDSRGRLVNPHLHAALKAPRFTVSDPRTAFPTSKLYRDDCKAPGVSTIFGVGATVDSGGNVVDPGRVNGTLVVELKLWESSHLMSMVFSIITQELFGYEVSFLLVEDSDLMAQRMSSVGAGTCSPVHVNVEVKANSGMMKKYAVYSNESYSSGSIGYPGRSGLYTTVDFIKNGLDPTKNSPTFAADFWRDYQSSEELLGSLKVSTLKSNSQYYPPKNTLACKDGSLGCVNSCSKTAACFAREAQGKECMVVAMLLDVIDPGYLQAVFENNDIPAYFCFLGDPDMKNYVVEMQEKGLPVVFHHFEPDSFHVEYDGLFERVLLPRSTPERSLLNTGTFGEFGGGKKTANPVRVDFPVTTLQKYSATLTQDLTLVNSLISRMAIEEMEINDLMTISVDMGASLSPPEDIMFSAACSWLRNNYQVWSLWLGRLPACNVYYYLAHDYIGCESENSTIFPREVHSRWLNPNPENTSMPQNCDGGLLEPPKPLITSKSCAWLMANRVIWIFWITVGKPACDSTFYTYNVSKCDRANSQREVTYHWLIPSSSNSSLSAECKGGVALPPSVLLNCGYVPKSDSRFVVIAALAGILSFVFFVTFVFVLWNRKRPIIKRSQYQFLLLLLFSGILVCGTVWSYAGKPTNTLCTTRSLGIAYGFTLIFGSLVVKSLRVYRVFMSGAMKRVVLSTRTMFKILGVFLLIDFVILAAWSIIDPPKAKLTEVETPEIGGGLVVRLKCTSTSFIFTALLIFWKAVLLFAGLYLSFLIRKVSSDFQESVWIFASALVVLFTSVIILALAYLVDLPAITFYLFFSFLLLVATSMVVALMIVPKILRLNERPTDTMTTTTSGGGGGTGDTRGSNSTSSDSSTSAKKSPPEKTNDMKSIIPGFRMPNSGASNDSKRKKSKVSVTPIQQFTINDE